MRTNSFALIVACGLAGCTSGKDGSATDEGDSHSHSGIDRGSYPPGALAEGFLRFEGTPIRDIEPATDATYCEYVMDAVDEDMNILEVTGGQGEGGHHLTVFGVDKEKMTVPMHTPFSCEPTNGHTELGTWLGSARVSTPEHSAFRLKKGQGLLLNHHYVNTSEAPVDGKAYFDIKMEKASLNPSQRIASIFAAVNPRIDVAPGKEASSSVDCTLEADMDFVMAGNHMHEWGTRATTSIVRAGTGEVIVLRDDPVWSPERQLNPDFTIWPVDEPFHVAKGDIMRTECTWQNTTAEVLVFPREMCISSLFMLLPAGATDGPGACQNGVWTPPAP